MYNVADEEHPRLEAARDRVAVDELLVPTEGYGDSVLVVLKDGTATTVTVVAGALRDVATHASVPLAAHSTRIGDLHVQLSDCRRRIDVAIVGAALLAVPASNGTAATLTRRRPS